MDLLICLIPLFVQVTSKVNFWFEIDVMGCMTSSCMTSGVMVTSNYLLRQVAWMLVMEIQVDRSSLRILQYRSVSSLGDRGVPCPGITVSMLKFLISWTGLIRLSTNCFHCQK